MTVKLCIFCQSTLYISLTVKKFCSFCLTVSKALHFLKSTLYQNLKNEKYLGDIVEGSGGWGWFDGKAGNDNLCSRAAVFLSSGMEQTFALSCCYVVAGNKARSYLLMLIKMNHMAVEIIDGAISYRVLRTAVRN